MPPPGASLSLRTVCEDAAWLLSHLHRRRNSRVTSSCHYRDLVGGDYAKVGSYLSTWTGVTALAEFVLNPTIGRLSDTYGRKPFMMLSPYAAIVLKAWVLSVC